MKLKTNPDNPRTISEEAFERLKAKIKRNPDGLSANKIVHKDGIVIAGNQRYRAIEELKLEHRDEWFKDVTGWNDKMVKEWLVTSNVSDGAWDWDILANQYELEDLKSWGVDLPYKANNEDDGEILINKKEITIEFETEEELQKLYEELTERGFKCRILTL